MTKQQAIEILKQLPANEEIRLLIDSKSICVDSILSAVEQLFWLQNVFFNPLDDNFNPIDCVQLESNSFDFALAYNSVMNATNEALQVEYTQQQQEQMWALHYETTQQNHVGYISATKGE